MGIPEETIRQVRENTEIVEIVSEYVALKKRGGQNYFGLCPFHTEKSPSFSVHPGRQTFHCFGCGKGGNVFTFLMDIERVEFPDAVRRLAERANITIDEKQRKTTSQNEILYQANELALKYFKYRLREMDGEDSTSTMEYLSNRGIPEEIIEKFELGLAPPGWDTLLTLADKRGFDGKVMERAGLAVRSEKGSVYDRFRERLMFPIRNAGGRVVAFGGRILKEDPEKPAPKYLNSPETPIYHKGSLVYGITQAVNEMIAENSTILVEGYTELIALHQVGIENSVATLGTALTDDQASLVKRFAASATLLYDADDAGINAAFRGSDVLVAGGLDVNVALLPDGEDPDSLARSGGRESLDLVLKNAQPIIDFKISYFERQGDLGTTAGKSEAARSLIATLTKIPNEITRQIALHEAAEKLRIDEKVLGTELSRQMNHGRARQKRSEEPRQERVDALDMLLQNLLKVMLNHPEIVPKIFNQINAADLQDHPLRPAFDLLEAAWVDGKSIGEADIFDSLNDRPNVLKLVNSVLARPDMDDPDFLRDIVEKTPRNIRLRSIEKEIELLSSQMKSGADLSATKRYADLKKEKQTLQGELRKNGDTEPS